MRVRSCCLPGLCWLAANQPQQDFDADQLLPVLCRAWRPGADEPLEANRVYRTTYMFSATMPPAVERLAR